MPRGRTTQQSLTPIPESIPQSLVQPGQDSDRLLMSEGRTCYASERPVTITLDVGTSKPAATTATTIDSSFLRRRVDVSAAQGTPLQTCDTPALVPTDSRTPVDRIISYEEGVRSVNELRQATTLTPNLEQRSDWHSSKAHELQQTSARERVPTDLDSPSLSSRVPLLCTNPGASLHQ